jgi:Ser/Thr protein kinase RdoA (MazF antagonist)
MGASRQPLPIEGADRRRAVFYQFGATIAQVHGLSDRWTPPAGFTRPAWDCDGLIGERPFWGRFWEAPFLSAEQCRRFSDFRNTARTELLAADADFGMIHADLLRENVLVREDSVCLIDFDDCGIGYRGFDLATCLRANLDEPDYSDLQAALFEGYASQRTLPDPELIPTLLALRALTYVAWVADRLDEPGMAERVPSLVATAERLIG